jgi:hypothetical protein
VLARFRDGFLLIWLVQQRAANPSGWFIAEIVRFVTHKCARRQEGMVVKE